MLQVTGGGCCAVPETAGCMTMQFLPDVYHREVQNPQKNFDVAHLVCKLWVSKLKKLSNSMFLEAYLLDTIT